MELIQRNEGLSSILTVKIVRDDYKQQVEKALKKARQTAQVKGFRTGNVPMPMIKKIYERSYIVEEVSKMVQNRLSQYLDEEPRKPIGEIMPYDNPVDWANDNFEFSFELGFYPAQLNFSFDDDTIIPYYNITVRPEDIDNRIGLLRESLGVNSSAETAETGDMISATCKLSDSENAAEKYVKFSLQQVPDEYKSLFIGARKDDLIEVEIRKVFPNDTDLSSMLDVPKNELDALPATTVLTVTEISRFAVAEMNREFFAKVGDNINNEEDLRTHVGESAKSYHEKLSLKKLGNDAIKVIFEKTKIELPEDFVKRNLVRVNKDLEPSYIEANLPATIESMKQKFIIETLLEREGVSISEEEVVDKACEIIRAQFDSYGLYYMDISEVVQNRLNNEKNVNQYISYIKEDKFAHIVRSKAKLDVKEITLKEFRELNNLNPDDNDAEPAEIFALGAESEPLSLEYTES